ncbi:MAG: NAD(P)H-dependent oxidoreductase [Alphaproteobacteria bacterium]|nr:NAD(P)H-dependent oxidoreductase [Alphaproteobacteria bacterium]
MSKILIIDGHQSYTFSKGLLSETLAKKIKDVLSEKHKIKHTVLEKKYDIKKEQEKFLWADTIIYQFPVFWFGAPALLKQYMQDVFEYGIFFTTSDAGYGKGGLLKEKTYMFSTTWNSPLNAFGNGFLEDISTPDDMLVALHYTHRFLGMKKLPSFSCHDVLKNPDVKAYLTALERHLNLIFNN